jgi:hypothetical protein
MDDKIYKYGEKCYKYTTSPTSCNNNKKIIDIQSPLTDEEKMSKQNDINSILLKNSTPVAAASPTSSTGFSMLDNLFPSTKQ